MNTTQPLSQPLQEAVEREAHSREFGDVEAHWLALVVQNDSTLPVPVAGAMVGRVSQLPVGQELVALDTSLQRLKILGSPEMTTSERRVTEVILRSLIAQAHDLLISTSS